MNSDPRVLYTLRDCAEYIGLKLLTGERCQVGMRMLCDIEEPSKFVPLFKEYFDLPQVEFADPWNSSGKGSVMLGRDMFLELAVFFALRNGKYVLKDHDYTYFFDTQEELEQYRQPDSRVFWPAEGANYRHAFTGRN